MASKVHGYWPPHMPQKIFCANCAEFKWIGSKAEEDTPEAATTRLQEPDLSKLNFDEETSIEEACISEKGDGPAAYYRCLNHQLRLLESAPKYQDLSDLGFTETTSIDEACISAKGDGPAAYNRCLTHQLRLLGVRPNAAAPQQ